MILVNRESDYPPRLKEEQGCKVGWYTFAKEADAKVAANLAEEDAKELWAMGYDFGFQQPGSITELKDGTFQVVIP